MSDEYRQYFKMMLALYESGDKESIDIYHKIQRAVDKNSEHINEDGNWLLICDEEQDEDLAKELNVSPKALKKAFKLFIKIGLVELCTDQEVSEKV